MQAAHCHARILDITRLGYDVQRITLHVPDAFTFVAGQYLSVYHPDGTAIPLSIASAPATLPELELHYRSTPGLTEAERMDALLASTRSLTISAAAGVACLSEMPRHPLALICGGTGISQALSILRQCAQSTRTHHIDLYWCADSPDAFYAVELIEKLALEHLQVHLCADDTRTAENEGLRMLALAAEQLSRSELFICGSPAFVYACTDTLRNTGWFRESTHRYRVHSDVFEYAPRDGGALFETALQS